MVKNIKMNKQSMTTESGRSMVEMLGTLAIIGVLSIGGIAGYNLGMEKQRANELLEASLQRAYTVSAQLLSGRNASLVEFNHDTKKAGGEFATTIGTPANNQFGIQIQNVNQNVCKALVRSITDNSPLRGVTLTGTQKNITEDDCQETNNLTLFYNENMTPTGNVNFTDPACAGVTCEGNLTCFHGECKCSDGTFPCGTECCAEGTYCVRDGEDNKAYICVAPAVEKGGCASNSDCTSDQYCKFSGGSCAGPTGGTCTDKGTLENNFTPYTVAGLEIYKSSSGMNWWNAKNLCQAHGKQLVTMADLGMSDQAGKSSCYFDHSKTTDKRLQCTCSGDESCTQIASELYTIGTSGYLWLADNSKANSCDARYISLSGGHVLNGLRNVNSPNYALCR